MKKLLENRKGITLIALVITIIVLLILAGVTIETLTGDNGILKQAESAKEETDISNEKEMVGISAIQAMGEDKNGELTKSKLQSCLDTNVRKRENYSL